MKNVLALALISFALLLSVVFTQAGASGGRVNVAATLRELVEPSPGLSTYRFTVSDASKKVIGYEVVACFAASRFSSLRQCSGTLSLPTGKIVFTGTLVRIGEFTLVVTGGDGSYNGAGGSMRQSIDGSPTRWSVVVALS
jgi:hypothetical protein